MAAESGSREGKVTGGGGESQQHAKVSAEPASVFAHRDCWTCRVFQKVRLRRNEERGAWDE